jgi:hypothetical protein
MMIKPVLLGLFITGFSFGQSLSVGILGGAPFTDVVHATSVGPSQILNNADKYTIGPSVQVNLPLGLRVEFDALYRPYGFGTVTAAPNLTTTTNMSAQQWRFPLLLQYRFPFPIVRPFVEAGPSFEHLTGASSLSSFLSSPTHTSGTGIVLGGGADLKIPFVRLSGEIRYTRETTSYYPGVSNQNQAEVLFGVHF